jgi:hypothetical protein
VRRRKEVGREGERGDRGEWEILLYCIVLNFIY